jgi:hypothetical protein
VRTRPPGNVVERQRTIGRRVHDDALGYPLASKTLVTHRIRLDLRLTCIKKRLPMVFLSCTPFAGQAIIPAGDRIGRPYIAGIKTKRIVGGAVIAAHIRRCSLRPFTRQTRVRVHAHNARRVPALITVVGRSRCFAIRDANERGKRYQCTSSCFLDAANPAIT